MLNCDAYNNYDPVSDSGKRRNVDGFGGHLTSEAYTGMCFGDVVPGTIATMASI